MIGAEEPLEPGELSRACRVLVKGDPDGDTRHMGEFIRAQSIVWNLAEAMLRTSKLSQKL